MAKPTSVYARGHVWSKDYYDEPEVLSAAVMKFHDAVEQHEKLKGRGFVWEPYTREVFAEVDSEKRPFYHDDQEDLLERIRSECVDAAFKEFHGL